MPVALLLKAKSIELNQRRMQKINHAQNYYNALA